MENIIIEACTILFAVYVWNATCCLCCTTTIDNICPNGLETCQVRPYILTVIACSHYPRFTLVNYKYIFSL